VSAQPPIHPGDEVQVAAAMSTELERLAVEPGIRALEGFADRVMAAVALEPLPQPARAFRVALLGGRLSAAIASVGDAWRVVVSGSTPLGVRAQSLALVLVLAIGSAAIASGAAVGAMGLLSQSPTVTPGPTSPLPSQPMQSPLPSPSSSPSPSPSASPSATPDAQVGASPSAEPTETPGSTQRARTPSPTATGTDDHGGSRSGSGGSGGGSGSGGGNHTPTPSPTESDDSGGSSDG
jgi:uncharacterized membrane protein YgcG